MNAVSAPAVAATVLLHAALIAAAALGLSSNTKQSSHPVPLAVQIVTAPLAPSAPTSVAPPTEQPAPVTKRPETKPRAATKPRQNERKAASALPAPPATDTEAPPVASPPAVSALSSSASTATVPSASAAPAAPAKTAVSTAGHAAGNRRPPYPRLSKDNNEEGTVVLRVLVKADGSAGAVEIKTSSGYPLLDKSARTTVQTWRFNPATVNGKPVDEWYEQPIPFKLTDD